MDLQEKLDELQQEIKAYEERIEDLKNKLKDAKYNEKQYQKLIEKAKALEK